MCRPGAESALTNPRPIRQIPSTLQLCDALPKTAELSRLHESISTPRCLRSRRGAPVICYWLLVIRYLTSDLECGRRLSAATSSSVGEGVAFPGKLTASPTTIRRSPPPWSWRLRDLGECEVKPLRIKPCCSAAPVRLTAVTDKFSAPSEPMHQRLVFNRFVTRLSH